MDQYLNILLDYDDETHVALLTINRADKLNALNRALLEELSSALDRIATEDRARALVITGAGTRAFVAGADIGEIASIENREDGAEFARYGQSVFARIEQLTLPVVMAINGYALGGGCELALCGDIRIASDTAQLGQPEVSLGVIPGYGGTQRMSRLIGRDRAKYLIFTGERVDAAEAYRLGLVDKVVPQADLMEAALTIARTLASKAPRAIALAKMAINEGSEMRLDAALDHEADLFGQVVDTQDRREGTLAFLEKRQPQWSGM